MSEPRGRLYPQLPGAPVRRRARADETWAGLTAPVTRMLDDGTFERYAISVECWIVSTPKPASAPGHASPREMVPTYVDADGVPVFVLS